MSTDGGGILNAVAYLVAILAVLKGLETRTGDLENLLRRPSRSALVLWASVAIPSLVQIAWPTLLHVLSRQPGLIRDHHEYWRLPTSAFVQDGGLAATTFNLVVLYPVSCLATRLWTPTATFVVFVVAAVVGNVAATYAFDFAGAGNSGATFMLAAAVLSWAAVGDRTRRTAAATLVVIGTGITLAVAHDAHGLAFLVGVAGGGVGGLAGRAWRPTRRRVPTETTR